MKILRASHVTYMSKSRQQDIMKKDVTMNTCILKKR